MDGRTQPANSHDVYICADCGHENRLNLVERLKRGDLMIIKCVACQYRVLYKKRTRKIVEYQAV